MRAMLVVAAVLVLCGCDGIVPFGEDCAPPDVPPTACRSVDVAGEDVTILCFVPVPVWPPAEHRDTSADITPD